MDKGDDPKVCCSSVDNYNQKLPAYTLVTVAGRGPDNNVNCRWKEGSIVSDGLIDSHS